jgi:L-lactate dehydrogenase complex protein LldG
MEESTNREKILKKVRNALIAKTANPYPNLDMDTSVYPQPELPLEVIFAENFMRQNGEFVLCNDRIELMESLLQVCDVHGFKDVVCIDRHLSAFFDDFEFPHQSVFEEETDVTIETVIVPCECLIARTGGIVFSPEILTDTQVMQVAQNVIVVAHAYQLVPELNDGLQYIKTQNGNQLPSSLTIVNGKTCVNLMEENASADKLTNGKTIVILVQHNMGEKE